MWSMASAISQVVNQQGKCSLLRRTGSGPEQFQLPRRCGYLRPGRPIYVKSIPHRRVQVRRYERPPRRRGPEAMTRIRLFVMILGLNAGFIPITVFADPWRPTWLHDLSPAGTSPQGSTSAACLYWSRHAFRLARAAFVDQTLSVLSYTSYLQFHLPPGGDPAGGRQPSKLCLSCHDGQWPPGRPSLPGK